VGYYNFSNVRYAQPPVGNLRWQPPLAPTGRSSKINDGSVGAICPQANPTWDLIAAVFIPDYLSGKPFDYNAVNASIEAMNMTFTEDPRTSEDCLFLDVYVPEKIFANRQENKDDCDCDDEEKRKKLSPVMVYIYGGGYTGGEKTGFGAYNPSGLFNASQNGVVIVNIK
jgi:carboxylesterase type B